MPNIPTSGDAPLIRTDFCDDAAWERLIEVISTPSLDGFLAHLQVTQSEDYVGASAEEIGRSASSTKYAVVFVADQMTMTHQDQPILCINVRAPEQMFRVVPSELWGVENNLSLANMDFDEFAGAVDPDGVFRAF